MGRIEISDLKLITSEPWFGMALISTRAKWRSSPSGWSRVGKKYLTQPALSERRFNQVRAMLCSLTGKLTFSSDPGSGTEIELTIPASVVYAASVGRRAILRGKSAS